MCVKSIRLVHIRPRIRCPHSPICLAVRLRPSPCLWEFDARNARYVDWRSETENVRVDAPPDGVHRAAKVRGHGARAAAALQAEEKHGAVFALDEVLQVSFEVGHWEVGEFCAAEEAGGHQGGGYTGRWGAVCAIEEGKEARVGLDCAGCCDNGAGAVACGAGFGG